MNTASGEQGSPVEVSPPPPVSWGPKLLVLFGIILIILGIVLAYFDKGSMLTKGHVWSLILPYGGAALGFWIILSLWVERGFRDFLPRAIFDIVLGAIGIFLVADNASRMANIRLDNALPHYCEGSVVKAIQSFNKSKTRAHQWRLKIAVPELGNKTLTIPCREDVFDVYRVGDTATLEKHPGAFGTEWWEVVVYAKP